MNRIKHFLLTHEPFKPAHMGQWIRTRYFIWYVPRVTRRKRIKSILDAGCGTGAYSRLLSQFFPDAHIRSVDIVAFKEWRDIDARNVSFETGDLTSLSERTAYDLIVSVDVLEHIVNNESVIQKFSDALQRGGTLYLAVPNESEEWHIFPSSWFSHFDEWEKDEHVGEQRTLEELVETVQSAGFDVTRARHTFTLLGTLAWEIEMALHWRGGRIGGMIRIILMPFLKMLGILDILIPLGSGNNLVIAHKR